MPSLRLWRVVIHKQVGLQDGILYGWLQVFLPCCRSSTVSFEHSAYCKVHDMQHDMNNRLLLLLDPISAQLPRLSGQHVQDHDAWRID